MAEGVKRVLSANVSADTVRCSRLMEAGEETAAGRCRWDLHFRKSIWPYCQQQEATQ